ncbi:hypothetical protein ACFYUV_15370 [Nonomuraea sp. NPDC003560]|uniref:hypothetical protein n=1 Tax=Nonomuraea sp. NPDC003560 TaxID=3364341 RepID=UPI0036A29A36
MPVVLAEGRVGHAFAGPGQRARGFLGGQVVQHETAGRRVQVDEAVAVAADHERRPPIADRHHRAGLGKVDRLP